jgi:hypothetical protein
MRREDLLKDIVLKFQSIFQASDWWKFGCEETPWLELWLTWVLDAALADSLISLGENEYVVGTTAPGLQERATMTSMREGIGNVKFLKKPQVVLDLAFCRRFEKKGLFLCKKEYLCYQFRRRY